jgi:hypothetical protein
MPLHRIKLVRDTSVEGFLSRGRSSTDAIAALENWKSGAADRTYSCVAESDDAFEAILAFRDTDPTAGTDLADCCRLHCVQRA